MNNCSHAIEQERSLIASSVQGKLLPLSAYDCERYGNIIIDRPGAPNRKTILEPWTDTFFKANVLPLRSYFDFGVPPVQGWLYYSSADDIVFYRLFPEVILEAFSISKLRAQVRQSIVNGHRDIPSLKREYMHPDYNPQDRMSYYRIIPFEDANRHSRPDWYTANYRLALKLLE